MHPEGAGPHTGQFSNCPEDRRGPELSWLSGSPKAGLAGFPSEDSPSLRTAVVPRQTPSCCLCTSHQGSSQRRSQFCVRPPACSLCGPQPGLTESRWHCRGLSSWSLALGDHSVTSSTGRRTGTGQRATDSAERSQGSLESSGRSHRSHCGGRARVHR